MQLIWIENNWIYGKIVPLESQVFSHLDFKTEFLNDNEFKLHIWQQ